MIYTHILYDIVILYHIIFYYVILILYYVVSRGHGHRKGGSYGWKPSSSSNFSIRVFGIYSCVIELRQAIPYRAIRADGISINSIIPPFPGQSAALKSLVGKKGRCAGDRPSFCKLICPLASFSKMPAQVILNKDLFLSLSLYIYVYMCVCVQSTYIYTYIHIYIYIYIYVYTYIYIYIYTHMSLQ